MEKTYHKIELDKNKISKQILDISDLAKKNNWKVEYNEKVDELTFGLDTMPRNSFLININDEINLFVTPSSKVNGIFIEYFANNYVKHNKEFEPMLKLLNDDIKKRIVSKKQKNALVSSLENKLAINALQTLYTKKEIVGVI